MSTESISSVPPFHVAMHDCARLGSRTAIPQAFVTARYVYRGRCAWCGVIMETNANGCEDRTVQDGNTAAPTLSPAVAQVVSTFAEVIRHYDGLTGAEVSGSRDLIEKHRRSLGEAIKKARQLIRT